MKLSSLTSPLAGTGVAGHERIDPFYDGMWTKGTQGLWTRYGEAKAQQEAGLVSLPRYLDRAPETAWETVTDRNLWGLKLAFLSAVDSYRTVTAEQVAAITGAKFHLSAHSPVVPSMFTSGLIDLGRVSSGLGAGPAGRLGFLYRPSRTNAFTSRFAKTLTYPELVSVTGGLPWISGGFYDRHNVLSTELLLRAAEYTSAATVLGEKFSTFDLLFGSGVGRPPIDSSWRGDGVLVRDDGVRIVFEVTASLQPKSAEAKVMRWAQHFDNAPYDSNGVIVCFVIANPAHDASHTSRVKKTDVRSLIGKATRMFPGAGRMRSRHRMFVADWQDWFPARGEVSPQFLKLGAGRGELSASGSDEPIGLLTDPSLALVNPRFDPLAVIDNAAGMRQTPLWMRVGRSPANIIDVETSACGLDTVPVPTPARNGRPQADIAATHGPVGPVLPPTRLRTMTHNFHPTEERTKQRALYQQVIDADNA